MFERVGGMIEYSDGGPKESSIVKERKVALYAGFEVRCPTCGYVPQYFVERWDGRFGIRFWCEVCKESVVLSKGVAG